MTGFLYRGISNEQQAHGATLRPRRTGTFAYTVPIDGSFSIDGSWTVGSSETNAVRRHELRQEGFPTAGVSTTPHFDRARYYALSGGARDTGYVLKIGRDRLSSLTVREFIVAKYVAEPSIPEDDEVNLVAGDGGELPSEIIVEVIPVGA